MFEHKWLQPAFYYLLTGCHHLMQPIGCYRWSTYVPSFAHHCTKACPAHQWLRTQSENYKSFWFTKLGLICSPGLTVSIIFNNFLSLLIPSIDTEQTHCCRCYITWINVANQITIWRFLLMTYNWLVIAVRFTIQGWEKETFKWYLGWSPWVLQAKIHSPQCM